MKKAIFFTSIAFFFLSLFFSATSIKGQSPSPFPSITQAPPPPPTQVSFGNLVNITLPNLCGGQEPCTVGFIINRLLPYLFGIAGFILLGLLVLGGFEVLVSQGDPKKIALGKDKITNAIVGFLIIFTAYWAVQLIARILNLGPIQEIFQ